MNISVLIPTHKRPDLLANAIQSVSNQSRRDLISEVIVSENSSDNRSEEVCKKFTNLPIRFVRPQPTLDAGPHFNWLVKQAKCDWIAMLSDDDMWGRYHLEEASRLLVKHPSATSYIGRALQIRPGNELSNFAWFRATYPDLRFKDEVPVYAESIWTPSDALAPCLLRTPLNIWASVSAAKTLKDAISVFNETSPGHQLDRYFIWRLVNAGTTVVGSEITLFVHHHANAESHRHLAPTDRQHQQQKSIEYSRKIITEARAIGLNPEALINTLMPSLGPTDQRSLRLACKNLIKINSPNNPTPKTQAVKGALRFLANEISPPALSKSIRQLKNCFLKI